MMPATGISTEHHPRSAATHTTTTNATVLGVSSAATGATGALTVGNTSTGKLTIQNGSTLTSTGATIGNASGSTGTVIVTGTSSAWTSSGRVIVGNSGTGTLSIASGGVFTDTVDVIAGLVSGSTGAITIDGSGSKLATPADASRGVLQS